MACEAVPLAINLFRTKSFCGIKGSYEQDPLPARAKSDLKECLPYWCVQPTASYRLVAVGADHVHDLGSEPFVTVGRNANAKVVLSSLSVSRLHAAFLHDSLNQTFLVDLGSTHGTYMDKQLLKPYTPTLVTKKSFIQFGTADTQYLLLVIPSEECVAKAVSQIECPEERDLYLRTQYNTIAAYPTVTGAAGDIYNIGRLQTFNFSRGSAKKVHISTASSAPQGMVLIPEHPILQSFASDLASPKLFGYMEEPTVASPPFGPPRYHDAKTAPVASSSGDVFACFTKPYSMQMMLPEMSIKRCATAAGVDEMDERAGFEESQELCAPSSALQCASSPRIRRRRMSEPNDEDYAFLLTAMQEREGVTRSYSENSDSSGGMADGDCASIGGSSAGFCSSISMSECEDDESHGASRPTNLKKRVRFSALPVAIEATAEDCFYCHEGRPI